MTEWIHYPLTLSGHAVDLYSMVDRHFPELITLAQDKRIWTHYTFDGTDPEVMLMVLKAALVEREKGSQFPFVIFHKGENRIIGSTRFLDLQPRHRKLEIGSTWLHPDHWATIVNPECKLLLLRHAFQVLQAVRVQLKTDEKNIRSRKAIEKIGGRFEGILRNDMIRDNGTLRHSAYYSVIAEEWKNAEGQLSTLCRTRG